jgi:hypothetical protein
MPIVLQYLCYIKLVDIMLKACAVAFHSTEGIAMLALVMAVGFFPSDDKSSGRC